MLKNAQVHIIFPMQECKVLSFFTPHNVQLNGLWFGPEKAETALIIVHGLGSNLFSNQDLFLPLVNDQTAVLFFNNQGHDTVTRVRKQDKRKKKGFKSILAGAAHEVFTESADDIQGVVDFVQSQTQAKIFLVGHSTGCQKSVYYQYKKKNRNIAGIILLAPMSDFAGVQNEVSAEELNHLQKIAKTLVDQGNPHTLLPQTIWPSLTDAQRFLSLYTPDSQEEVFPYSHDRNPKELQSIKTPILVILAEKDEYRDRPMKKIAAWFDKTIKAPHEVKIIKNANHSFNEHSQEIQETIISWLKVLL